MKPGGASSLRLIEGGGDRQAPASPTALAFARALARQHVAAMLKTKDDSAAGANQR